MPADTPQQVQEEIQRAIANESMTELSIVSGVSFSPPPPLTAVIGVDEVIRDLLRGGGTNNHTLEELDLSFINPIGPEVTRVLGQGLTANTRLQKLNICSCHAGSRKHDGRDE